MTHLRIRNLFFIQCLCLASPLVLATDSNAISLNDSNVETVTGTEGAHVQMWCNDSGIPNPNIRWYVVQNDKREDILIRGPLLQILNLSRECTQGVHYECEISSDAPQNLSKFFSVRYEHKPEVYIYTDKENATGNEECLKVPRKRSGRQFDVTCAVDALPSKNITWYRNGTWIGRWDGNVSMKNVRVSSSYKMDFRVNNAGEVVELVMAIQVGDSEDYQWIYECVSINKHGTDKGCVRFVLEGS